MVGLAGVSLGRCGTADMNIRNIAKLAGVSVASVSRTLSGKDPSKVSAGTRAKILEICEDMRYSPNVHMLRISGKRANTVSFLFPPKSHFSANLTDVRMDDNLSAAIIGAQEELDQCSSSLLLTSISEGFLAGKEYLKLHRSKTVDGLLIWGWTEPGTYLDELTGEGVPFVMLQGGHEDVGVNSVNTHDEEGMRILVDHAVSVGHRRIAIVTPSISTSVGRARCSGAVRALESHGISPSWFSREQGYEIETGYKACREILAHAPDTTCIIGSNDLSALGAINAAKEMGIEVPGRLSVTGADGLELYGQVNLTTYASHSYAVGRAAAKLLQTIIDEPGRAPEKIRVPVRFVCGNTVGPSMDRLSCHVAKRRQRRFEC